MKSNQRGEILYNLGVVLLSLFIAILVFGGLFVGIYRDVGTHRDQTFTVNKTERVTDSDGKGAKYLVYTDNGVYENTDSILNGKFNSSDVYNQLQPQKTYTCDVVGWRAPFLSWYPNVISCQDK